MIFDDFPKSGGSDWAQRQHEVNLSFSGASVFFFTPYRVDGTPMPASVMKFDQKECGMAMGKWEMTWGCKGRQ